MGTGEEMLSACDTSYWNEIRISESCPRARSPAVSNIEIDSPQKLINFSYCLERQF